MRAEGWRSHISQPGVQGWTRRSDGSHGRFRASHDQGFTPVGRSSPSLYPQVAQQSRTENTGTFGKASGRLAVTKVNWLPDVCERCDRVATRNTKSHKKNGKARVRLFFASLCATNGKNLGVLRKFCQPVSRSSGRIDNHEVSKSTKKSRRRGVRRPTGLRTDLGCWLGVLCVFVVHQRWVACLGQ